jgi:long-chain fatty acid transport protein
MALAWVHVDGRASAQSYGIEFHNNLMPASGAMAGTSFTRPQDIQSALNGNPATLRQFQGPVFGFGGAFVEATYNVTQSSSLPLLGVSPYAGKSDAPASLLGNIGVIHQTELLGLPVSLGLGFISSGGAAVDFRHIDASNGTHASYVALDTVSSAAIDLTSRLSVGTTVALGTHVLDGPFVQSSSSQTDYATRFTLGANYELGGGLSVGAFWQSEKDLTFDNVVRFASGPLAGVTQDISLQHPQNVGFGIANRCLMAGRLLLAADVLYKNWDNAEFFQAIFDDQWAYQFGAQYLLSPRVRLRAGYAYNDDPTRNQVPGTIGGVIPVGGIPAVRYVEGQFAAITQHRLTGGIGIHDVIPNTDFDATVGGSFENSRSFGATRAEVDAYFITFGFTFHCPNGCD